MPAEKNVLAGRSVGDAAMSGPAPDGSRSGFNGLTALPSPQDPVDAILDGRVAEVQDDDDRSPDDRADGDRSAVDGEGDRWDAADDVIFLDDEPSDWAWVEEWRSGGEPVPWGPGLALSGFTTFLVASAVYVLSAGLSDRPIVAIGVNVLVAGGLGPALWLSRSLPVLRWIAGGAVVGVLAAWLSVLIFLA